MASVALFPERAHLVGAYSLGKAQRVIAMIREAGYDAPIYLHGAMEKITRYYESRGVALGQHWHPPTALLPIRTAEGIPPAVCEAAPMAYAIVICFASCFGSSRVLEVSTNRKSAPFPAR